MPDEHKAIRPNIDRLRAVADCLGVVTPLGAPDQLRAVQALLDEVMPAEQAEQDVLYPAIDRLVGGNGPPGPMTRRTSKIAHRIRRPGRLGPTVPTPTT